jgi:hypothetical protein
MAIEPEKRPRGRPRKVHPPEPVARPRCLPGRKKARDTMSPESVSLITRAALDRHGLHSIVVPEAMTQRDGIVILRQHGLSVADVARVYSRTEKLVRNTTDQWRAARGVTIDQWKTLVQANSDARRQHHRGVGSVYVASPAPRAPAPEPPLSDEDAALFARWPLEEMLHAAGVSIAHEELECELGREASQEEAEKHAASVEQIRKWLNGDADVDAEPHNRWFG